MDLANHQASSGGASIRRLLRRPRAAGPPTPTLAPSRTLPRCRVCGFAELRTDEVVDRGVVFLAECPRCEHRFTSDRPFPSECPMGPAPQRVRPALPAAAPVARPGAA